ncbi:MAG: P-loop NTPase fold protein [Candidatus Omnitrophota bacterium]
MIKPNPFTPRSGQEPKVFLNRDDEIAFFEKRMHELQNHDANHYILNGSWGVGKTSLLKYFKLFAQEKGFHSSYFSIQEFPEHVDDEKITVHILQSISRALPLQLKKDSRLLKYLEGFGIQVLGTGFNVNFRLDKNIMLDSQSLLLDGLINIWGELKDSKGVIVLIDDAHNLSQVTRYMTTIRNVLSHDDIMKGTNYLFILSSTVEGWKPFMIRNHPIGRFFIPRLELKRFNQGNTYKLIEETLKGTGVKFGKELFPFIWEHTNGHLFEVHSLCRTLYDLQERGIVGNNKADIALNESVMYLGTTIFEQILSSASEREKEILYAISFLKKPSSIDEITNQLGKLKIKKSALKSYLSKLVDKNLLSHPKRGLYVIEDRMFRLYVNKSHA